MQSTGEAMKIQMSTETKTLLETTGGGNFKMEPRYSHKGDQITLLIMEYLWILQASYFKEMYVKRPKL